MKISTFKEIVEYMIAAKEQQDNYTENLPSSFQTFLYENEFCMAQFDLCDFLVDTLIGNSALVEELYWFIWDWVPGSEITTEGTNGAGSITYVINTVEDFIEYVRENYDFE